MQTKAWIYSMSAMASGALALMMRWAQTQIALDSETGLYERDRGVTVLMVFAILLVPLVLRILSGRMPYEGGSQEPEEALACPAKELKGLFILLGIVTALSSALMFFTGESVFAYVVAGLGLAASLPLCCYLSLPQWEGWGAFLSLVPVAFFSVWLVYYYKTNAIDPSLWSYGTQILAIAGNLLASYRLAGYVHYRCNARQTMFACGVALAYSVLILIDDCSVFVRLICGCWGIFFGIVSWILVNNLRPEEEEEE